MGEQHEAAVRSGVDQLAQGVPVVLVLHILQVIKQQNAPPAVGRREREALVTGGQVQNILPAQQSLGERGLTEAAGGALKKRTRPPAMKRSKRSAMADLMMISGSFHPP